MGLNYIERCGLIPLFHLPPIVSVYILRASGIVLECIGKQRRGSEITHSRASGISSLIILNTLCKNPHKFFSFKIFDRSNNCVYTIFKNRLKSEAISE